MKREENNIEVLKSIIKNSLKNAVEMKLYDEKKADMFIMRYVDNKPCSEIAGELGLSISRIDQVTVNMMRRLNYSIILMKRDYFDMIEKYENGHIKLKEAKEKVVKKILIDHCRSLIKSIKNNEPLSEQ